MYIIKATLPGDQYHIGFLFSLLPRLELAENSFIVVLIYIISALVYYIQHTSLILYLSDDVIVVCPAFSPCQSML